MANSGKYAASDATADKQESFRSMFELHLKLSDRIFNRRVRKGWQVHDYRYYELNAGLGRDPKTGAPGSPLISIELLQAFRWKWTAEMYEIDDETFESLFKNMPILEGLSLYNADNEELADGLEAFEIYKPWHYGLAYADPTKAPRLAVRTLAALSKAYPQVDIMFNLAATGLKRSSSIKVRLKDMLNDIGKTYWMIREPIGAWQWAFLFGTNWKDYPELKTGNFHSIESDEGEYILNRCNFTAREQVAVYQVKML